MIYISSTDEAIHSDLIEEKKVQFYFKEVCACDKWLQWVLSFFSGVCFQALHVFDPPNTSVSALITGVCIFS